MDSDGSQNGISGNNAPGEPGNNQTDQVFQVPDTDMSVENTDQDGGSSDTDASGEYTVVRRSKRSRLSTGGRSGDNDRSFDTEQKSFEKLSIDDKLSATFSKINNIGRKVDKCLATSKKVTILEKEVKAHTDRITLLEYKSLDMEARSRRNNLLFGYIPEATNENCYQTICNFLATHLGLDQGLSISRVHRLGRYSRDSTRPIIAQFIDWRDTELVLSKAKLLRNTDFSINRDYPKEIAQARKKLWSDFKDLRAANPNSKVIMAYPAKVIIDGRVKYDMFPDWNLAMKGNRVTTSPPTTKDQRSSYAPPPRAANGPSASESGQSGHVSAHSQPRARSQPAHSQMPRSPRRESRSPPYARNTRDQAPARHVNTAGHNSGSLSSADTGIRRPWDPTPPAQEQQRDQSR